MPPYRRGSPENRSPQAAAGRSSTAVRRAGAGVRRRKAPPRGGRSRSSARHRRRPEASAARRARNRRSPWPPSDRQGRSGPSNRAGIPNAGTVRRPRRRSRPSGRRSARSKRSARAAISVREAAPRATRASAAAAGRQHIPRRCCRASGRATPRRATPPRKPAPHPRHSRPEKRVSAPPSAERSRRTPRKQKPVSSLPYEQNNAHIRRERYRSAAGQDAAAHTATAIPLPKEIPPPGNPVRNRSIREIIRPKSPVREVVRPQESPLPDYPAEKSFRADRHSVCESPVQKHPARKTACRALPKSSRRRPDRRHRRCPERCRNAKSAPHRRPRPRSSWPDAACSYSRSRCPARWR